MDCGVCSKLGIRCSRKWVMGMEDMVMCLDMGRRYLNKVCNGNVRMCMSKTNRGWCKRIRTVHKMHLKKKRRQIFYRPLTTNGVWGLQFVYCFLYPLMFMQSSVEIFSRLKRWSNVIVVDFSSPDWSKRVEIIDDCRHLLLDKILWIFLNPSKRKITYC